ncbi:uncharacterized protein LOC115242166, partial [Formica exsecta]|uniref:uncharacterized protein LOC115242166 n=1 Tax=Formica exsecta TaxID=72781 RepID=UPI001143F72E
FPILSFPLEEGYRRRRPAWDLTTSLCKLGHIQTNCKSQPRCAHCGDKGHTYFKENCQRAQNPPRCVNCQGEHRADSTLCPELSIQKEIRKYAAYRNVSLLDAREIFKDPSCSCGYPMQDADHTLWNCPLYHAQRTSLLAQLIKLEKTPPFKIQDILEKPSSGVVHALYSFFRSCNLSI